MKQYWKPLVAYVLATPDDGLIKTVKSKLREQAYSVTDIYPNLT